MTSSNVAARFTLFTSYKVVIGYCHMIIASFNCIILLRRSVCGFSHAYGVEVRVSSSSFKVKVKVLVRVLSCGKVCHVVK